MITKSYIVVVADAVSVNMGLYRNIHLGEYREMYQIQGRKYYSLEIGLIAGGTKYPFASDGKEYITALIRVDSEVAGHYEARTVERVDYIKTDKTGKDPKHMRIHGDDQAQQVLELFEGICEEETEGF